LAHAPGSTENLGKDAAAAASGQSEETSIPQKNSRLRISLAGKRRRHPAVSLVLVIIDMLGLPEKEVPIATVQGLVELGKPLGLLVPPVC
jgi:hypothetical protein